MKQSDMVIQHVAFADEGVEIAFFEVSDLSNSVQISKTIQILLDDDDQVIIDDIIESLQDIVNKAHVTLRNPPSTLRDDPRSRIKAQAERRSEIPAEDLSIE